MLVESDGHLVYRYDAEQVWLESWGGNALRIRATKLPEMPSETWALQEKPDPTSSSTEIGKDQGTITNGKIKAVISNRGKTMIHNSKGDLLLEEYVRNKLDIQDPKCSSLNVDARELKPLIGGDYSLTLRLESLSKDEKIFGMVGNPPRWKLQT